jgi:cyclohexyl-isocyanide hydratase
VTAGIDFALTLTAAELGEDFARRLQLQFEYDPAPPFDAGSPEKADPDLVAGIRGFVESSRAEAVSRLAARLA